MKKITSKLMDFGMDFQYENNGSQGEVIESFELGIKIYNQKGKITLNYMGENDEVEECETGFNYIANRIQEICIEETT